MVVVVGGAIVVGGAVDGGTELRVVGVASGVPVAAGKDLESLCGDEMVERTIALNVRAIKAPIASRTLHCRLTPSARYSFDPVDLRSLICIHGLSDVLQSLYNRRRRKTNEK